MLKRDALSANPNWTGNIVSILDYHTGDEWGHGINIKMCNKALPNPVMLNLLREKYTWTGSYVKGPEEGGYDKIWANGNLNFVE